MRQASGSITIAEIPLSIGLPDRRLMNAQQQLAEKYRVCLCFRMEKNAAYAEALAAERRIPIPVTAKDISVRQYYCGNGNLESVYRDMTETECAEYLRMLEADGFRTVWENQIGENVFRTLKKGGTFLSVARFPNYRRLQTVFSEAPDFLPPDIPAGGGCAKPCMIQPGRQGAAEAAPGMSYLFRLADGSWLVIDGGPWQQDDAQDLLRLMRNGKDEKPVISLWLFSHYHGDHIGLAYEFLKRYGHAVDLRAVAYNFPDADTLQLTREPFEPGWMTYLPELISERFPNVRRWNFHSGEKLRLPGAEIEILFTHEDNFPVEMQWGNDTSSAWTVTQNGKKYLFLGDCDPMQCRFLADNYGESLKCDVLQLTHHGFNGAIEELYRLADPDICLWVCDRMRFEKDGRCLGILAKSNDHGYSYTEYNQPVTVWEDYRFNRWLRDDTVKKRIHHHAGEEIRIP